MATIASRDDNLASLEEIYSASVGVANSVDTLWYSNYILGNGFVMSEASYATCQIHSFEYFTRYVYTICNYINYILIGIKEPYEMLRCR